MFLTDACEPEIDALLNQLSQFGIHLGLERIQRLLAQLHNPHAQIPVIHIAGTNGKGSVCAYLSTVLTAAGYRVGRYTSPHLVHWQERITVNQQPISGVAFYQVLQQVLAVITPQDPDPPTQFEVLTAAAWLHFAQAKVDIAIVEVGLGGRLDATNVCDTPLMSIITSISRDHWQQLGNSLSEIAGEKAGILKPGCPAIIGPLPAEATTVVQQRLRALNCPTTWVEPAIPLESGKASTQGLVYPLSLPGVVQLTNSALAIAAVQILRQQGWQISDQAIVSGLSQTVWPGRLQWMTWKNQRLLVDGAHNEAGAIALRQFIDRLSPAPRQVRWVMGMMSSKDHTAILQSLLNEGDSLYLVPISKPDAADPYYLADVVKDLDSALSWNQAYPSLTTGLESALKNPAPITEQDLLVLCGSLYLVGAFLSQVQS